MKRQRKQDSAEDCKDGDLPCVLITDATDASEIVHTIIELDGSVKSLSLLEQALEENFKENGKWKYDGCANDGFGVDDLDGLLTGLYKDKDEDDEDYVDPNEIVDELCDYFNSISIDTVNTPVEDRNKDLLTKWHRVKYMITLIES